MDAPTEELIDRFLDCFTSAFRKSASTVDLYAQFGITRPQFFIMKTLEQCGPLKVTQLAEHMEVKPSAITVMIDRLVAHHQVARMVDEQDRRVVMLHLTEAGSETIQKAKKLQRDMMAERLTRVDRAELERFLDTFEKIME